MRLAFALLAGLILGPAPSAMDVGQCADKTGYAENLGRQGFRKIGSGLASNRTILELWVDDKAGDWLVLMMTATGYGCLVARGGHWIDEPPLPLANPT